MPPNLSEQGCVEGVIVTPSGAQRSLPALLLGPYVVLGLSQVAECKVSTISPDTLQTIYFS